MPDVLAREVSEDDKSFIESYALRHGVTQAEVVRMVLRIGIDQLRLEEPIPAAEWAELAESLRELADPEFEERAWG